MMRLSLVIAMSGLVVSGCASNVRLYARADPPVQTQGLRTFAVGSVEHALPGYRRTPLDPETLAAVRADVEADFKARGYTPAPLGEADFIVCVASGSRPDELVTMERDAVGYLVGRRAEGPFVYTERTLVIDVFDRDHARRVWHGSADDLLQPTRDRRAVAKAIRALVERFPGKE